MLKIQWLIILAGLKSFDFEACMVETMDKLTFALWFEFLKNA